MPSNTAWPGYSSWPGVKVFPADATVGDTRLNIQLFKGPIASDKLGESILKHDKYDEHLFNKVLDFEHPTAQQVKQKAYDGETSEPSRLFDLFGSMYKMSPQIKEEAKDTPAANFLNEIMSTQEYSDLRSLTALDEFASTVASFKFFKSIQEQPEDSPARKMLEGKEGNEKADAEGKSEARYAIRQMLQEAAEETQQVTDAMIGMGKESSPLQKRNLGESLAAAQRLLKNPKMLKIAELAGRMTFIAKKAQKEKLKRDSGSYVGVEMGSELSKLLPTEIVRLSRKNLKKLFYRDFLDNRLQQYETELEESKSKGPIVCCLDCSGSMSGQSDVWSKAVAVTLSNIAKTQKRPFCVILFNAGIKSVTFGDAGLTEKQINELASTGCDGGTDFVKPFGEAFKFIRDHSNFHTADIIFITDGEATIPNNVMKTLTEDRRKVGINLYSFFIGNGYSRIPEVLTQISDEIFNVEDLTEKSSGLKKVFAI